MKHSELNKPAVALFAATAFIQFVLFILKVSNVLKCSWIWIFAPLWMPYAVVIAIGTCIAIYLLVYNIRERIFKEHG